MVSKLTADDRRRFTSMQDRLARTTTLGAGDHGGAVRALENVLTSLGFAPGAVDADFTRATGKTLATFQQAVGLQPTGTLDTKTLGQLEAALSRKRAFPGGVTLGQQGEAVARAERQLNRLGYTTGPLDGVANRALGQAISAFKADQPELLDKRKLLAGPGQAALSAAASGLRHAAYRGRFALSAEMKRANQVLAGLSRRTNQDGTQGLTEGASRPAVVQLQRRLRAAGFDPRHVDGVFDERTRGALEAFQRASGVTVTGRLDAPTWKLLSKSIIDSAAPAAPVQKRLEKSAAVLKSERLLEKAGFATGPVDGLYSAQTQKAVRAFERQTHRRVDGGLGARNLAALRKLASTPFPEPKADYRHLPFRGVTLNGRTIEMVNQAERWAKQHGVPGGWPLFQGSYHSGTSASAGTHDGGGALDMNTAGLSAKQIRTVVEAMRRAGFAAWHRAAPAWADDHIHAIAIGDRDLSSGARSQVREYFAGGDGLTGSAPDPHPAIGRPIPAWAKKFS